MHHIQAAIVLMIILALIFVPTLYLKNVNDCSHDIKQALNLSAKALGGCVRKSGVNLSEVSRGYKRDSQIPIEVDKERLLKEFYEMLYRNCMSTKKYNSAKDKLLLKAVVYYDRFFTAGREDSWSPPYYFTYKAGNELVYLNTQDDTAAYYDSEGALQQDRTIEDYGIDGEQKNNIIIDKINSIAAQYTSEKVVRDKGLKIQIRNPANMDPDYKVNMSYFNVLEGVTFFVVYAENPSIAVNSTDIRYQDYNVVGYTIDYR